jgi:uncharacterized protein YcbX
MTKLKPTLDLEINVLRLEFENHSIEISLENDKYDADTSDNNLFMVNSLTGVDQGDPVSRWLSDFVFKTTEQFRLIRIKDDENTSSKSSFVNKADYLLVNENSVKKLRAYLAGNETSDMNIENSFPEKYLHLQFRPNIVVSVLKNDTFMKENGQEWSLDEELWTNIKILNKDIEFDVVENCTRCQMINIDQSSESNLDSAIALMSQMLLKQLYKMKANSKFGIYLSKRCNKPRYNDDLVTINRELAIGDIGIASKYIHSNYEDKFLA